MIPSLGTVTEELLEYTFEGQIVSLDPASKEQLRDIVTLTIDGQEVKIPRVVIARDADNNPILDEEGNATYRYSTVYDAATELYVKKPGDENPIPILCHREHLRPVAVCRVCMVEIRSGGRAEGKLAPACHRMVDEGVEVLTCETSERVRRAVGMVTELLVSDQPDPLEHSRPSEKRDGDQTTELPDLARRFNVPAPPRVPAGLHDRGEDTTSSIIEVDHNACILCDRCVRACTEVKHNNVIGRTGRGYTARIGFDLDQPMGDSSCVACGECAISCPTDALTLLKPAEQEMEGERVSWQELAEHPLFAGVSSKFLAYNENAYARQRFRKGDVVCREGDFGSTAYLIERGRFQLTITSRQGHVEKRKAGLFGLLNHYKTFIAERAAEPTSHIATDTVGALPTAEGQETIAVLDPEDILFGEMTCMSNYPRSTTVTAIDDDCSLIAVRRNILYTLQRNTASRRALEKVYRWRSSDTHLRSVDLFQDVQKDRERFDRLVTHLRDRVQLIKINPGQTICRQGDLATYFDMVRVGFVRVSQTSPSGEEIVRNYIGPGGYYGELALLTQMPEFLQSRGGELLPDDIEPGRRSATCRAMDHVEIVRIPQKDFEELYREYPEIGERLARTGREYLQQADRASWNPDRVPLGDFLDQGLANAHSLLVLDLESCTRCDECTRACSDAHEGVTRLIRDGLRFDKYLVASSCRSCQDPYCMVGCPVDAIHRRESLEMVIEDWCIGCGLCASNCPYGNINMHPVEVPSSRSPIGSNGGKAVLQMKATMCDLCADTPHKDPSCVYACPHDAAHRMTGEQLLHHVSAERTATP